MMFTRSALEATVCNLQQRARDMQRQVDDLAPREGRPAKAGYRKKLDRLQDIKHALMHAENRLNKQ